MSEAKPTELLPERCRTCGSIMQVVPAGDTDNFTIVIGQSVEGGFQTQELAQMEMNRRAHSPAQADRDRIGDFALKFIRETYGPCPESETPEEERWHARVGLLIHAISIYEESKQQ